MYLTHLSLTNFRNFARLDIDVPRGPVLLVGANGQGKTSLLEAIYFLATFSSFHADHDRQMINFLTVRETLVVGRIVAVYTSDQHQHRMEARIIQEANGMNGSTRVRKEALVDNLKVKISEAVGIFNAVLFLPQMVRIIEGPPDERRRFLNLAISQVSIHYHQALTDYMQALGQRNALLKQLNEFGGDANQLEFWDRLVATHGALLIQARIAAIQELERSAARIHRELTRGAGVLRLAYQPAYDPLPIPPKQYALPLDAPVDRSGLAIDKIEEGFLRALAGCRSEDIGRGMTTIGPHRDELRFVESGIDLGVYGSRGQVRTAMLALKFAEVEWMQEKTGRSPVLLLDEALAELDPVRRGDLLERLAKCEQMLLTTTDLELFSPDFIKSTRLWQVQDGRVVDKEYR
jgi:DNA replication and repair protein RecF